MNYGPLLFLVAFFALSTSWFGFVLTPHVQLSQVQPTNGLPAGTTYPVNRPGMAHQGLEVYRANGCATCHSQQLSQTATGFEVQLTEAGTNQAAIVAGLLKVEASLTEASAKSLLTNLPRTVFSSADREAAEAALKLLKVGGAKPVLAVVPKGPDMKWGWGNRRSVADDYLYDYPVMCGAQRVGPDLANIGVRQPDLNWHLLHLYAPQTLVKGSMMPPYRFLFEKRVVVRGGSPEALKLPAELSPGAGYEIVPRPEAKALAQYLASLRSDVPVFSAPYSVPAPATNTPAQ
jgi:cbb3-type cytochrome oxidase cytochrome c subunit